MKVGDCVEVHGAAPLMQEVSCVTCVIVLGDYNNAIWWINYFSSYFFILSRPFFLSGLFVPFDSPLSTIMPWELYFSPLGYQLLKLRVCNNYSIALDLSG